ncbi:MAG: hypothetical protein QOG46_118 [Pseudonocardiales bacterium]|nr:hypothetical protein [Pseudonocardiales bacterium]
MDRSMDKQATVDGSAPRCHTALLRNSPLEGFKAPPWAARTRLSSSSCSPTRSVWTRSLRAVWRRARAARRVAGKR